MAERFSDEVVQGVTGHMNDDHTEDSLLIVRANSAPEATAARMVDLDTAGGTWLVTEPGGEREVTVAWPREVVERADVRHAVVDLYEAAAQALGQP